MLATKGVLVYTTAWQTICNVLLLKYDLIKQILYKVIYQVPLMLFMKVRQKSSGTKKIYKGEANS